MLLGKRKLQVICLILVLVVISGLFILGSQSDSRGLSLYQAIQLAKNELNSNEFKIYYVSSIDNDDLNVNENGHDGKRRYWNVQFTKPNTDESYLITIHDKKVIHKNKIKQFASDKNLIDLDDIKLSTKEAVKIAEKDYKLTPGQNWAGGYHFTLNKDTNINLTVYGLDKEGYSSQITFDGSTKALISANHKVPKDGGIYIDNKAVSLNSSISPISYSLADYDNENQDILLYYTVFPFNSKMQSGASLLTEKEVKNITLPQNSINMFLSKRFKDRIYCVTSNAILFSNDLGKSWNEIYKNNDRSFIEVSFSNDKFLIKTENVVYLINYYGEIIHQISIDNSFKSIKYDDDLGLFAVQDNRIMQYKNDKFIELDALGKGNFLGIEFLKGKVLFYDNKHIITFNPFDNKHSQFVSDYTIEKIFKSNQSTNDIVYILSNNKNRLIKCNLNNKLVYLNSIDSKNGSIVNATEIKNNKLLLLKSSQGVWENLRRE